MPNQQTTLDWESLLPKEPALIFRCQWPAYAARVGLPYSRGHMQHLDSAGRGPAAIVVAGKVAYTRASIVRFLETLPVSSKKSGVAA